MSNLNPAGIFVTDNQPLTQSSATATAIPDRQLQVISWGGCSSLHSAVVTLTFGSTEQARLYTQSGMAVSEYYGDNGPMAATNTTIEVMTDNRAGGTGWSSANLLYRIVM